MDDWNPMDEDYRSSTGGNNADDNMSRSNGIYIRNIPMYMDKLGLQSLFCKYGTIVDCFVTVGKSTTTQQFQFGRVVYRSFREAEAAVRAMNNALPLRLQVSFWKFKEEAPVQQKFSWTNDTVANGRCNGSDIADQRPRLNVGFRSEHEPKSSSEDGQAAHRQMTGRAPEVTVDADLVRSILASQAEPCGNRVFLAHEHKDTASAASKEFKNASRTTVPCFVCKTRTFRGCTLCWTRYCSRECQKSDWNDHKKMCAGRRTIPTDWSEPEQKPKISSSMLTEKQVSFQASGDQMKNELEARKPQPEKQTQEKLQPSVQVAYETARGLRRDWLGAAMPPNTRVKVNIAHINGPNDFFVLRDDKNDLCKIMGVIGEVENASHLELQQCEVGMLVAAQFDDGNDILWYRARLEKILPNTKFEIFYVDFGNSDIVDSPTFKPIPEALKNIQPQAIGCMLDGFSKSNYPVTVVNKFREFTTEDLWGYNVGFDGPKLIVKLESCSSPGLCINEVLKECNNDPKSVKLPSVLDDWKNQSELKMTVAIVDDNSFWAFVCIGDEDMVFLSEGFHQECEKRHKSEAPVAWKVSEFVSAKSCAFSAWYRARILEVGPNRFRVQYVDYGNSENVEHVISLQGRAAEIPCLAVLCSPLLPDIDVGTFIEGLFTSNNGDLKIKTHAGQILKLHTFDNPQVTVKKDVSSASDANRKLSDVVSITDGGGDAAATNQPILFEQLKELDYTTLTGLVQVEIILIESCSSMYVMPSAVVKEAVEELQLKLSLIFKGSGTKAPVTNPSVGSVVCAIFKGDGCWCRCVVEDINNKMVMVRYVDFGNVDTVSLDKLAVMPPHFLMYPKMSIHAAIAGAADDSSTLFQIKSILGNRKNEPFNIKIADTRTKPMSVYLFTSDGKNVAEMYKKPEPAIPDKKPITCTLQNVFMTEKPTLPEPVKSSPPKPASSTSSRSSESEKKVKQQPPVPKDDQLTLQAEVAAVFGGDPAPVSEADAPETYTLSNAPSRIMKVGESVRLTVLEVITPEVIFFMMADQQAEQLDQLDKEINKYCCAVIDRPKFGPNFGDLCLAKYSGSKCWHRGSMMVFGPEESTVLFVDYGNMESVRNFNVLPMEKRFMKLPLQAIQCQLNDCVTDREWPESILNPLMSAGERFLVKVVKYDEELGVHRIEIPSLTEKFKNLKILKTGP